MRTAILFMMKVSCVFGRLFGRLLVGPQNAAVIAGEGMSMECRVDEESRIRKWELYDVDKMTFTVYTHEGGNIHKDFGHFGVKVNINGSGILYTNSTKLDDAGNYSCITRNDNKSPKFSAQLIVFESEPKCETNFTRKEMESLSVGDVVWMRCSVTFRGFGSPTFQWSQHWRNGETGIEERRIVTDGVKVKVDEFPSHNNDLASTLSFAINPAANGSFFSCRISFSDYDGKDPETTASNRPEFNFTWESDVIKLSYSFVSFDTTVSAFNATLDVKTSPSKSSTDEDRYFGLFMVVAGLSIFLVLIVIVAIAFCIHYKRKVSVSLSPSTALDRTEGRETTTDDITPYAVSDNYEAIDEFKMDVVISRDDTKGGSLAGPYVSQGYSKLEATQPTPPSVYSRMVDHSERPINAGVDRRPNAANIPNANEQSPDKPSEDITRGNVVEPHPYLDLSCDFTDKSSPDEKTDASSNKKETKNDADTDSSNSNSESPAPYKNVGCYERPQTPLNQVQVSPTATSSAYTDLLSTKKPQPTNPDIPIADCRPTIKGIRNAPKPPPRPA